MSLPLGLAFEYPSATSAKPHYVSYASPRTIADDGVFEIWNGPTVSSTVFRINKDGQIQVQVGTLSAPSIVAEADKDTGVNFKSGTPEIELVVAGAEVLSAVAAGVTVTGTLTAAGGAALSGTITGTPTWSSTQAMSISGNAATAGTVTTAAQPNITSVGTLTGLAVSGAVVVGTSPGGTLLGQMAVQSNSTNGIFEVRAPSGNFAEISFADETGPRIGYVRCHFTTGATTLAADAIVGTTGVAFYGALPIAQQVVGGSREGNVALASLLNALNSLNLIDDQSTA